MIKRVCIIALCFVAVACGSGLTDDASGDLAPEVEPTSGRSADTSPQEQMVGAEADDTQREGPAAISDGANVDEGRDRPVDSGTGSADERPVVGPAHFVDRTSLIADNEPRKRYGMAVTDFDLDGDFEVVVAGYGGANEILDWRDSHIVDVAPAELKDPSRRAIGVAACDVTGDGEEEIYFLNIDRFGGLGEVSDRLFRRADEGWSDLFEDDRNRAVTNRFAGRSVACLDGDGDGRYSVFVAIYGGPMKLFDITADGRIADGAAAAGVDLTTGGRSLVVIPGPQGLDLFAGNENGANFYFRNNGDGIFTEEARQMGIADPFETVRGVALLDADGDGLLDLVYGNWEGPHRLFRMTDRGTYQDTTPTSMAQPSRIRTVVAADFDNDGTEEIFWNNIGQPNRLFGRIDGQWQAIDIGDALEPDGLGTGAAVVDIDGDGTLELFIAHGESGAQSMSVYRWGQNANRYLRIQPKTAAGAPARGATVTIERADGTRHSRVIDSGSGYLCQMEPVAHFGLGLNGAVQTAEVSWPDGRSVLIDTPSNNQTLVIPYPTQGNGSVP